MKKGIHPKYYKQATITDSSSGAVWTIGSTRENMTVEISSITHPFYTGKQKIVDTDDLVKKFEDRKKKINLSKISQKRKKKIARKKSSVAKIEQQEKVTLKDMLKQFK
jgi:large subunit ribosomal protein L31